MKIFSTLVAALACAIGAAAQEPPAGPRAYDAVRVSEAPTIDGRLDDSAWSDAAWTEPFLDIRGAEWPTPTWLTRAKIAWDDGHLYIGADLEEPHLWSTLTDRDAIIYRDNDFEVFLDPNGDGDAYYELEINTLGTEFDLFLDRPYIRGGNATIPWDMPGLRSAIDLRGTINDPTDEDDGWSVEIAIPWTDLVPPDSVRVGGGAWAPRDRSTDDPRAGRAPRVGEEWRVNFSRVQWPLVVEEGAYRKERLPENWDDHPEENWVWSPQGVINMHLPEMWGVVRFVEGVNR